MDLCEFTHIVKAISSLDFIKRCRCELLPHLLTVAAAKGKCEFAIRVDAFRPTLDSFNEVVVKFTSEDTVQLAATKLLSNGKFFRITAIIAME